MVAPFSAAVNALTGGDHGAAHMEQGTCLRNRWPFDAGVDAGRIWRRAAEVLVPAHYDAVEVFADDGILGGIDNCRVEQLSRDKGRLFVHGVRTYSAQTGRVAASAGCQSRTLNKKFRAVGVSEKAAAGQHELALMATNGAFFDLGLTFR